MRGNGFESEDLNAFLNEIAISYVTFCGVLKMKKKRILIQDQDGKGSITAYVIWFHNAIMQKRQIAFDGVKWFVQANLRAPFKPIGESEVPVDVKKRMFASCGIFRDNS